MIFSIGGFLRPLFVAGPSSVDRLVHRIDILCIHAIVNIIDANVDDPVSVFGHMVQAPCNPASQQPTRTHTNCAHL